MCREVRSREGGYLVRAPKQEENGDLETTHLAKPASWMLLKFPV